jgi:hypothetical protein
VAHVPSAGRAPPWAAIVARRLRQRAPGRRPEAADEGGMSRSTRRAPRRRAVKRPTVMKPVQKRRPLNCTRRPFRIGDGAASCTERDVSPSVGCVQHVIDVEHRRRRVRFRYFVKRTSFAFCAFAQCLRHDERDGGRARATRQVAPSDGRIRRRVVSRITTCGRFWR